MRLRCQGCGASLEVGEHQLTTVCPYCACPTVLAPSGPERHPDFVLGFTVPEAHARKLAQRWLRQRSLFSRAGLRDAKLAMVKGVYVPAYLYSATAKASFRARIGETYRRKKGKTTVTETEWHELSGPYTTQVPEVLVSASASLTHGELEGLEPFELGTLRRFSPAVVSGWWAEEPSLPLPQAQEQARAEATALVEDAVGGFMPGDRLGSLEVRTHLEREATATLLVPLWIFAARYAADAPPLRVLVNGQTGAVTGGAPLSWQKIALAALIAALIGFLAVYAAGGMG